MNDARRIRVQAFAAHDGLKRVQDDWGNSLEVAKTNGFYHLYDLYYSYLAASHNDKNFFVIALHNGDEPVALLM